jgi:hypothetical protein
MGDTLLKTFHWIHLLIFITQLFFAMRLRKNVSVLPIMKHFYWYPIVGTIVTSVLVLQHLNIFSIRFAFCFNAVSLLFHYLFLSYFIFNATGKNKYFRMLIWLFFLLIPDLIINDILSKYIDSNAFSNACLFFYSLFYFYLLYKGDTKIQLLNNPIFYVCCGILIGTGLIVPAAIMVKVLVILNINFDVIKLITSVSGIGYVILNLFFIKAILCNAGA